jgi:hypothetical protein
MNGFSEGWRNGLEWFCKRRSKEFFGAKKEYRKTNLKGAVNLWIEG